jgi:hypothetical protein
MFYDVFWMFSRPPICKLSAKRGVKRLINILSEFRKLGFCTLLRMRSCPCPCPHMCVRRREAARAWKVPAEGRTSLYGWTRGAEVSGVRVNERSRKQRRSDLRDRRTANLKTEPLEMTRYII